MSKLFDWLRSIPFLIFFSFSLIFYDILQRIFFIFGFKATHLFMFLQNYTVFKLLQFVGIKFELDTACNKFETDKPLLIISNHQSLMDIPIIWLSFKKFSPRFIAKKELAKNLPFISFRLRHGDHGLIDRSNKKGSLKSISKFANQAKESKFAISIFPEGTRARTGELKKFKVGGIGQILKTFGDCQIGLLVIEGSWKIAKHKLMPVPSGIVVKTKVLGPYSHKEGDDINELLDNLYTNTEKQINEFRK